MLTETTEIRITVLPDGQLEVRKDNIIKRDGVEIAREVHRHVVHPGMDVSSEATGVRDVATVVHTPAVIEAWNAAHPAS